MCASRKKKLNWMKIKWMVQSNIYTSDTSMLDQITRVSSLFLVALPDRGAGKVKRRTDVRKKELMNEKQSMKLRTGLYDCARFDSFNVHFYCEVHFCLSVSDFIQFWFDFFPLLKTDSMAVYLLLVSFSAFVHRFTTSHVLCYN